MPANSPIWNFSIPVGGTYAIPQNGTWFEFLVQTGQVAVRASTKKQQGQFNIYPNGTGEKNLEFEKLEVKNLTSVAVVCSMFVGTTGFINRNLILPNAASQQIINPVYAVPNTASTVNIPDLSGGGFTDINGGKWLALSRLAIDFFNLDSAQVYLLQKYGATLSTDPSAGAVQPLTPVKFAYQGNFTVKFGSNINAIITEIYNAIPQT